LVAEAIILKPEENTTDPPKMPAFQIVLSQHFTNIHELLIL